MKHVLIVDDDRINRLVARRYLEKAGYAIREADSGHAALDLLQSPYCPRFAAILMDIEMPVLDGIETTRRIRSLSRSCRGVPIIAVSAYSDDDIARDGAHAGITAFFGKPIDFSSLIGTIESHT